MSVLKRVLLAVIVLTVVVGGYFFYKTYRLVNIGAGFAAKVMCSSVFISGRTVESVWQNELALKPLRYVDTQIDPEQNMVKASGLWGLCQRRAVYRPGLGATLDIPLSSPGLPDLAPALLPNDEEWPLGTRVDLTAIPSEINSERLNVALDSAFSEPFRFKKRRTRAVIVVYKGKIVAERYAAGFDQTTPQLGWSMTKSVVNALVGILVKQGKLVLNEKAPVPDWRSPDDPRGNITLDHLLRMKSGLVFNESYRHPDSDVLKMLFDCRNAAEFAADQPLKHPPGKVWHYSSGTTNIISAIIRWTVSDSLQAYWRFVHEQLFLPLGMKSAVLEPDPSGTFVGSSYMYATPRDWARFGLFCLQDGVWQGERILPEGWIDYSTRLTPESKHQNYGAHFWLAPQTAEENVPPLPEDLFYLAGHDGQYVSIVPSRSLIIVRLGLSVHTGVWDQSDFVLQILEAIRS